MSAIFGFTFCPVGDRKISLHIYIYMELTGDEPVLKPIDGHLGKTTQSSVFVSKSYCETSKISFEFRPICNVSFKKFERKYY